MKIPDRTETPKKRRTMNPISLSVMVKSMEMIYFTQVTSLQHQQLVISERGISAQIIRNSELTVNQTVYLDFIKRGVIPFIKKHHSDGNFKFWLDLASSHHANPVVNYLTKISNL
ncbi:hypothetical protein BpHYR1_022611 [Brachionus plicatilis]|uniref:Uncharacterized protein n=1 Tax=Brachionus plicatilis TaxID=10195 RepID=A0A3M7TA54_BRAPC|nr:hypothetical protein BpHYR1_022611 [Brachionus plicatilis]